MSGSFFAVIDIINSLLNGVIFSSRKNDKNSDHDFAPPVEIIHLPGPGSWVFGGFL